MKATGFVHPALLAVLALGLSSPALAFHRGGTGECTGCHSMHTASASSSRLLKQSDAAVCLSCHQSPEDAAPNDYRVATPEARMPVRASRRCSARRVATSAG